MRIDKPEISGLIVLFIGVGLLAFTFLNAFWLLSEDISILGTQDLVAAFGQALAPLVATCIHIMYLGIMGWIGSLLTLRGIPLLTHPKSTVAQPTPAPAIPITGAKPAKTEVKAKEKPRQEEIEKPQPPVKPQEEPKKEPEKPEVTIEVRPPEEVAAETPREPSAPQSPSQA